VAEPITHAASKSAEARLSIQLVRIERDIFERQWSGGMKRKAEIWKAEIL
jgi:hypothetical protein